MRLYQTGVLRIHLGGPPQHNIGMRELAICHRGMRDLQIKIQYFLKPFTGCLVVRVILKD